MASHTDLIWYLDKVDDDGHDVFGPVNLDNLKDWAMAAKISPQDRVSKDGKKTWDRAPMIPELHMDWLVEVSDDFIYGPNTIGTIQDFIANGEIDESTWVINTTDGTRCRIADNPSFKNATRKAPVTLPSANAASEPADILSAEAEMNRLSPIEMQKRIFELEALVLQQKRTIMELRQKHQVMRAKLRGVGGQDV